MKMVIVKLIAGITLGMIVGVLIAPQQGEKTRQKLSKKTAHLKSRARDVAATVRESETPRNLAEGGGRIATGVAGAISSAGQQVGRMLNTARQETSTEQDGRAEDDMQEYERPRRESGKKSAKSLGNTVAWVLAGSLVGVGIGMLLAPKPGRETREELAAKARRLKVESEDIAARLAPRRSTE